MVMRRTRQSFKLIVLAGCVFFLGCANTKGKELIKASQQEELHEAAGALGAVAGSYAGKQLSEEELKALARQIEKDEEAQSAIRAITGSMESNSANIKYSPKTGKRYSGDLEYEPGTGVKLLPLEP